MVISPFFYQVLFNKNQLFNYRHLFAQHLVSPVYFNDVVATVKFPGIEVRNGAAGIKHR